MGKVKILNPEAERYGLPLRYIDENGKMQSDLPEWLLNRPENEIHYYGKPKGWKPKNRREPEKVPYGEFGESDMENPLDEYDPELADENENILPDIVETDQDIINSMAYYTAVSKQKMEAQERYDKRKWWQFWIREDDYEVYPIEKEPIHRDKYGRIIITHDQLDRIEAWDAEREKKRKLNGLWDKITSLFIFGGLIIFIGIIIWSNL